MTNQQAFSKVVRHLRKQGKAAISEKGLCRYRMQDGRKILKCAIGGIIPKNEYEERFEQCSITKVLELKGFPSLKNVDRLLLYELQLVHDTSLFNMQGTFSELCEIGFKRIVEMFPALNLKIPENKNVKTQKVLCKTNIPSVIVSRV